MPEKDRIQEELDRELAAHVYHSREGMPVHSYEAEQALLRCVRHGDTESLAALPPLGIPKVQGPSAADPHRKFLYDMVALDTLATRAAIEGGLHVETAYLLSDLYIRQLDAAKSLDELVELGRRLMWDFTYKVQARRGAHPADSLPIRRCMDYVCSHLHEKITLADAAAHCRLNEKYLSRLFVQQTGQLFHAYVQQQRIYEARRLLAHTDMPIQVVGNTLAFSSQSYFTKVFALHAGCTPQQYRKQQR